MLKYLPQIVGIGHKWHLLCNYEASNVLENIIIIPIRHDKLHFPTNILFTDIIFVAVYGDALGTARKQSN